MPKQIITNGYGEPIGWEEIPTPEEAQEAEWERQMDQDGPEGVRCPNCEAKLNAEDAWDYGDANDHDGCMCWKCDTKF